MAPIVGTKITIGGLAGTGKGTISKLLAEKLGYKLDSAGNYFRSIADREEMSLTQLEVAAMENPKYDLEADDRTRAYGEIHDRFIFEGRIAWYTIKDSVKILLTCEYGERIRRIANRDRLTREGAQNATAHREEVARERYRALYGIEDITDEEHYDLVIDTTMTPPEDAVAIIIGHLSYMSERR